MKNILKFANLAVAALLLFSSCQKLNRPVLGDYPKDPPVPPYNSLKSFFSFENNTTDAGENKLAATSNNVSYVAGVTGQAIKFGPGGYVFLKTIGQTNQDANGFVSIPSDTLSKLGSYTLSLWMNGTGPVQGGAQGVFAISNKNQFWGNLEIFLENWSNAADPSEAYLKVHMFNANVSGGGEEWNETKIPGFLNKWSHLAITYDDATSKLTVYANGSPTTINGKVLGGGNYGKLRFTDFNGAVLGTYAFQTSPSLTNHGPESWAQSFNGAMDQFRLYNKALTAAEISSLYTSKQ